jgi:DNA-3-methyladenine glycosylase I
MSRQRCAWCLGDEQMVEYHDTEWGTPIGLPTATASVAAERAQFEFLILEGAQAGLSWRTVLRKRTAYRVAFADFDAAAVAKFDDADRQRLLADAGIIRNRLKIEASINNAQRFLEVQQAEGSFCRYLWQFVSGQPLINAWDSMEQIPGQTDLSRRISADLKKRGFRFVGPTIVYAHLQAAGLVNDHLVECFRYAELCDRYPAR